MIIYAGIKGFLDDLAVPLIRQFETEFYAYMEKNYPNIEQEIAKKRLLDDDLKLMLDKAIAEFREYFRKNENK